MGGILADYAKEMCAEVFNPEKLIWENPHQRPNHFWDCEVMALVCAWELGIRQLEAPEPEPARTDRADGGPSRPHAHAAPRPPEHRGQAGQIEEVNDGRPTRRL